MYDVGTKFTAIIYFIDIHTLSLIYLTIIFINNRDTSETFGIKVDWINVLSDHFFLSMLLNIQY